MMTRVVLGGALGRLQGKEWFLDISSPREAIQMINANKPGFVNWIRKYMDVFANYRVTCEYEDGTICHLTNDTYFMENDKRGVIRCVRYTPILSGSGKWAVSIVGTVLIVVGAIINVVSYGSLSWLGTPMMKIGAGMVISGIITALMQPSAPKSKADDSENQYYFNGPVNTTDQGVPIPLVFGRCKVGSRVINSGIEIKQK